MSTAAGQRSIWQRLLGIPATATPRNNDCWEYSGSVLRINLDKAPELIQKGTALRLEGKGLPKRVLVHLDINGNYHAFHNRCTHLGHRRLDPLEDESCLQCCSVGKSRFDLEGKNLAGPAKKSIDVFSCEIADNVLYVYLQ